MDVIRFGGMYPRGDEFLKGEVGHLDMGTIKAVANAAAFEWR